MNSNAWFLILVLIPVLSIVVIFHNAAHAFIHQREREKKKLNIGTDSITLPTVIFYKSGTFDWYSDTISILSGAKG